ncbi:MAG: hypothetical protein ACK5LS_02395 [Propioniciclava sp.]
MSAQVVTVAGQERGFVGGVGRLRAVAGAAGPHGRRGSGVRGCAYPDAVVHVGRMRPASGDAPLVLTRRGVGVLMAAIAVVVSAMVMTVVAAFLAISTEPVAPDAAPVAMRVFEGNG